MDEFVNYFDVACPFKSGIKALLSLKQGHNEMNRDFMRRFHDLLHSTKATLPEELKRDLFINTLHPEVHVEVLKMKATTYDSAITRCLALEAIEIQAGLKKPPKPSQRREVPPPAKEIKSSQPTRPTSHLTKRTLDPLTSAIRSFECMMKELKLQPPSSLISHKPVQQASRAVPSKGGNIQPSQVRRIDPPLEKRWCSIHGECFHNDSRCRAQHPRDARRAIRPLGGHRGLTSINPFIETRSPNTGNVVVMFSKGTIGIGKDPPILALRMVEERVCEDHLLLRAPLTAVLHHLHGPVTRERR